MVLNIIKVRTESKSMLLSSILASSVYEFSMSTVGTIVELLMLEPTGHLDHLMVVE